MADERVPSTLEAGAALVAGAAFGALALFLRARTLLPEGFFDALAAASFAWGLSVAAHQRLGAAAGVLLRGGGVAFAALLLSGELLAPFDRAAVPLAAWALGATLLQASTRARAGATVLYAIGVLGLAVGVVAALVLGAAWPEYARLRLAVLAGAALVALGLVLRALLLRRSLRALAPGPVGVVLVAALAATYLTYRPLVATRVANLPLYEWTLGVSVALLLLGRLRRSARDAAIPEAWTSAARRHAAEASPVYDARMAPLAAAVERYLETGEGFEAYRAALLRAAPNAAPAFRKALQGVAPLPGRGRAAREARAQRAETHRRLLAALSPNEVKHGPAPPPLR